MTKIINKWISLRIEGVKLSNQIWEAAQISLNLEAALQMCYYKKAFWKYAANLHDNIHVEVPF